MRAPTKAEAAKLADAHERAAAVMRRLSQGKVSELEAGMAYVEITTSVQTELDATEAWRRRKTA